VFGWCARFARERMRTRTQIFTVLLDASIAQA
jgi:hypothetical protein